MIGHSILFQLNKYIKLHLLTFFVVLILLVVLKYHRPSIFEVLRIVYALDNRVLTVLCVEIDFFFFESILHTIESYFILLIKSGNTK